MNRGHHNSIIKNADRIVMMNVVKITHVDTFKKVDETSPYFKKKVELLGKKYNY